MRKSTELVQAAYDQIAEEYDRQWSVHLRGPQSRLTAALGLLPGMRCADLGCGTGIETLDMVKLVRPGEVVGVDCSPGMLEAAKKRAASEGLELTTKVQEAEDFIRTCDEESFDVITMRFCLAYVDFRDSLPRLTRLLRQNGRIGILNNLANSGRQAYSTYRAMIADVGLPDVPVSAPPSLDVLADALARGGATIQESWTHEFRLWFESGARVASWLRESGFATHPKLQELPSNVQDALWASFADRFEAHREPQGLPLDFEIAGVVAVRS